MSNQIKAWSLSRLNLFEQCPYKFKLEVIDKRPTKPSYALEKGNAIHKELEEYLKGNITGIPRSLKKIGTEIRNLLSHHAEPEKRFSFDQQWDLIEGKDAWFNKKTWLRMIFDAQVDNLIVDLKTGKMYDKYEDQANLFATGAFIAHPEYDNVDVEFWYCKTGGFQSYTYDRKDLPSMIAQWNERSSHLFDETEWKPKANEYCCYCEWKNECPLYEQRRP